MATRRFTHKPTGNTGQIYCGRADKMGRVHCLLDNGEFAWLRLRDLEAQPDMPLELAIKRTGRPPDDLLHFAKSCDLTLRQVVEALTQ